jgi:TonB-linked SusC/RagA family outer membrane protein
MQVYGPCKVPVIAGAEPKLFLLKQEIPKILLVMKITAILLFVATLQVSAKGWGQEKINLSFTNAPLEQVLNSIEAQANVSFFYREQYITGKKITIDVTNASLKTVLDLCVKSQDLSYKIVDKTVAILPSQKGKLNTDILSKEGLLTTIEVKGRLVNEKGEPVEGVTVSVKGNTNTTITNANGEFTLHGVDENAVLIITHVQYESQMVSLGGKSVVSIALQTKVSSLDELQVIAYGITTKKLNTGNVTTVKGSDITNQPVSNPLLALQGRVPGLIITQAGGLPGSGVIVRIQGLNSITKGNDPLYVVDGIPYTSQLLPTIYNVQGSSGGVTLNGVAAGSGNPLDFINPTDIESIEVLKDADATSIYGSRAANGAILITTRKGKSGKTKVDFNFRNGLGKVGRKLDLLNTTQYLIMRNEGIKNASRTVSATDYDINNVWDTTSYTDWQKELIGGMAHYLDANASVSGGSTNTQFLVGTTYHRETTVFPGDFSDLKGSVHFSINNTSTNNKLKFNISGSYLSSNNSIPSNDITPYAMLNAPTAPRLYNVDGSLNWAPTSSGVSTWTNPLAYLEEKYSLKTTNLISNMLVSYQLFKNLELKTSLGYTNLQTDQVATSPLTRWAPELRPSFPRTSYFSNNRISSYIIEPQLAYTNNFLKGKLELLAGTTFNQSRSNSVQLSASGFNNDLVMKDIRSASSITAGNTFFLNYKYNAIFGRVNYNWNDKYIINLTARRDGSSRFGSENLFHNFWSIGGAWLFSREQFLQGNKWLSFGKLRASYGTSGNDQIGDYQFMNLFSAQSFIGVSYQGATGLVPDRVTNPNIQWEETNKLQLGIDLGFMHDRFLVSANFYRNRSSNQLLQYALPITTGFSSQLRNFPAKVENRGLELNLTTVNVQAKNFKWTTSLNFSLLKNTLVAFPDLAKSTYASILQIDKPINISKVYRFAGANPNTGVYQFYDAEGQIIATPDYTKDATQIINLIPTFFGGFQNTVRFKSLELDALFQFVKQQGAAYRLGNRPGGFNRNQPLWVLDRWQKTGDVTDIQKFSSSSTLNTPYANASTSDINWGDASYIRLKTVSLSWTFPNAWSALAKFKNIKLFAQGQNLLTITKYKGLDPETLSVNVLPPLRLITFGIQATF